MGNIDFDTKDFEDKLKKFSKDIIDKKKKAVRNVASEILRRSENQVPHDIGTLQNSGFVEDKEDESLVGYNTVYAARLHENPQFNFQKGRKGKYLEDPIKHGLTEFRLYFQRIIGS